MEGATDMATDTGMPGNAEILNRSGSSGYHRLRFGGALVLAVLHCSQAVSAERQGWFLQPRLSLAEIYTDNVNHDPDIGAEHDFVTQIQPGISVIRDSTRLRLNLDYQLQGLVYARGTNDDDVYQRLFGRLDAEPVPGWLYLDASASIGQTIVDATQNLSVTNIVGKKNRTEVRTFGLAPYLRHDFGPLRTYVRAEKRLTRYERGASDSDATLYAVRLDNSDRSSTMNWSIDYQDEKYDRETAQDVRFRNLEGQLRYRLMNQVSLLGRAGRADNSYQGVDDRRNGGYWAAGVGWQSRLISVDLFGGSRDKGITLGWTPNIRTSAEIEYRNRKVGRIFGPTWRARITHKTRRSRIGFQYRETTLAYEQVVPFRDNLVQVQVTPDQGLAFFDPVTGEPLIAVGNEFFSLTDSTFNRKRGSLSYFYQLARSRYQFSIYRQKRTELATQEKQDSRGLNASWSWRFGSKTRLSVFYNLQRSDFSTTAGPVDYRLFSIGINRSVGVRSELDLSYLRSSQDSDSGSNNFTENRVTLSFRIRI